MERQHKHCMERKKRRSGSNPLRFIHLNVSNQMMLTHSNAGKFFLKKTH